MNSKQHEKAREYCSKMADVIRRKAYSLATERRYCGVLYRYFTWLVDDPVGQSVRDAEPRLKVETFLTEEAKRGCAASTQNNSMAALIFWYEQCNDTKIENIDALRAKTGEHVRQAPAVDDVRRLLMAVRDRGAHVRDLQEVLGHRDIKTTMRYLRPDPERVASPLESLDINITSFRRSA